MIWQPDEPFSAGANLKAAAEAIQRGDLDSVRALVAGFQAVNLRLRYAAVPTVAAVRGLALGGGLELAMHAARRVAHLESYMGLVEAGVGLLPAGGGLGTLAFRVHDQTRAGDSYALLEKRYKQIAMGQGLRQRPWKRGEMGYLRPDRHHRLARARTAARRARPGSRPERRRLPSGAARPRRSRPPATSAWPRLKMMLVNMLEGHFISEHDYEIGSRIATVICGGDIDRGTPVNEEWMHALERKHFRRAVMATRTRNDPWSASAAN